MNTNEKLIYTCLDCIRDFEAEGERRFGQRRPDRIVPSIEEVRHREKLRKFSYFSLAILNIFRAKPCKPKFGLPQLGMVFATAAAVSALLAGDSAPCGALVQKRTLFASEFAGEWAILMLFLCPASAGARYLYYRLRQLPRYRARDNEWRQYYTCHRCGKLDYKDSAM